MQKHANLVSRQKLSNQYLLFICKFGFDTAENESVVRDAIQVIDGASEFIFSFRYFFGTRPAPSPVNLVCGLSRFSCLGPEEIPGTISF